MATAAVAPSPRVAHLAPSLTSYLRVRGLNFQRRQHRLTKARILADSLGELLAMPRLTPTSELSRNGMKDQRFDLLLWIARESEDLAAIEAGDPT